MAAIYSVQVYKRNLAREFQSGGQGYRWFERVGQAMFIASVAAAPARSGDLKSSHRLDKPRGINQFSAFLAVYNVAPHADWVHSGTTGPIEPTNKAWLYLPAGGGFPRKRLKSVSGQAANPWMDRACTRVAMSNGAVPIG